MVIVILLSFDFLKQKQEPYHENYDKMFQNLIKRPIDPITKKYFKKLNENVISNHILQYSNEINSGQKILKKKNIVVCGLVYNADSLIPKLEKWFNDLSKLCKSCDIVIVENNSIDKTRQFLELWKSRNPKHVHLVCQESECKTFSSVGKEMANSAHKSRIEKMSYLRNKYLTYIKNNFKNIDYVFVKDFDLDGILYWDGIFHSIFQFYVNPEKQSHDQDVLQYISRHYQDNLEMDKVVSAFGGFSIYEFESFTSRRYNYYDKGYSCEHCLFHETFDNIQVNPRMLYIIFENKT